MAKYGNSYSGNSLNDYWKKHYGADYNGEGSITKTDSMTDEDVVIGKELLNIYNTKNHLTNNYGTQKQNAITSYDKTLSELEKHYGQSQGALDKSKQQSQQMASIAYDKLKKYLPEQMKAQGLAGLGVSDSAAIEAQNSYLSRMGSIESDYQDRTEELLRNYEQNRTATENEKTATLNELEQAYGNAMFNAERDSEGNMRVDSALKEYQTKAYDEAAYQYNMLLEEGEYLAAKDYLEKNKEILGDSYNTFMSYLDTKIPNHEEVEKSVNADIDDFTNYSGINARLEKYSNALTNLESLKDSVSKEEYNNLLAKIESGTRTDYTDYKVKGLGTGRNNDDIDIIIGGKRYDLQCGEEVTSSNAISVLNQLTSGSAETPPNEGRVCVVANNMYIYTKKGWRIVKNDRGDVSTAVENFISANK